MIKPAKKKISNYQMMLFYILYYSIVTNIDHDTNDGF